MASYQEILAGLKSEIKVKKDQILKPFVMHQKLSEQQYFELLETCGVLQLAIRNKPDELYIIDKDLKKIALQLYFWLTNSPKFEGKLTKGIGIIGRNGSGKTMLMQSFFKLVYITTQMKINQYSSKKIVSLFSELGLGQNSDILYKPLFIDDFGKEPKLINIYGNQQNPLNYIISEKYDASPSLFFFTANYTINDIEDIYTKTTSQRLSEMCNIFELNDIVRRN
jgi:DNA replication protein DnaC